MSAVIDQKGSHAHNLFFYDPERDKEDEKGRSSCSR